MKKVFFSINVIRKFFIIKNECNEEVFVSLSAMRLILKNKFNKTFVSLAVFDYYFKKFISLLNETE
jgi:hypothetical protein